MPTSSVVIRRAIKLSSPKLTNITAFGCILVYAAVILLGLDYSTLPAHEKAFPVVCTVSCQKLCLYLRANICLQLLLYYYYLVFL